MTRIISVVGATGIQGGSVVRTLLKSGGYHVRAITRNAQSSGAKALSALGAEVVQADADDYASLEKAFAGSYAIFAVTNFFEPFATLGAEQAIKIEVQQGINLAKAAAATPTLEHYIWSTLPNSRKISGGTHVVPHLDGKNQVDDFIKSNTKLAAKTTFFWVPFYAQNFRWSAYTPIAIPTGGPGKFIQIQATPQWIPMTLVGDAEVNVGLFTEAILAQPEKTRGRFVIGTVDETTAGELLQTWAKAQNKQAEFIQIPKEELYRIWPVVGEELNLMSMFWEAVGERSWSGEEGILTKEDLGVKGLVSTFEAFSKMTDWN